jgi:hypothetical protein
MDRLLTLVRLLSLVLAVVVLASACSDECEPNPEEGEYCEAGITSF